LSFFKKIFGKKEQTINSYNDFWEWFQSNAERFLQIVKAHNNIETAFFVPLDKQLKALKPDYQYLCGMYDEQTAELILSADGNLRQIAFVEELVQAAPEIKNWKITALKQASDIEDCNVEMFGYNFNNDSLQFYEDSNSDYPDQIELVFVHNELTEENKNEILTGINILLDIFLGELEFATQVDYIDVIGPNEAVKDLIPLVKLKEYLKWRHKEFIEKYEGTFRLSEEDEFLGFEAILPDERPLIAFMNKGLLNWEAKASHPWMLDISFHFDGDNNNGLPDDKTYALMDKIEDEINAALSDKDGFLNIGRQTGGNGRLVYIACKSFRKPSLVIHDFQKRYADQIQIEYDIVKDKYWLSLKKYNAIT
jgi:hypothetical protein